MFHQRLSGVYFFLLLMVSACDIPFLGLKETPVPAPSNVAEKSEFLSASARNAKAKAEILKEILQVVFIQEPKNRSEFGNWVDTLNQGASFEGVYNGLIHSTDYRNLEISTPAAAPGALRLFAEELGSFESELPRATVFYVQEGVPVPFVSRGDTVIGANRSLTAAEKASAAGRLTEQYSKQFVGNSLFTLKRLLGGEALRVISLQQNREQLARWYAQWVMHILEKKIGERKIDFGIPLRNKADEAFHYQWALKSSDDLIQWEVLNRLHRILNEANR